MANLKKNNRNDRQKMTQQNKIVYVRNILFKAIYCFKCIGKLKVSMVSQKGK